MYIVACIAESRNALSSHFACVLAVHDVATRRKSATLLGVQFELFLPVDRTTRTAVTSPSDRDLSFGS